MSWTLVGNFLSLIGAGAKPHTLAVYNDELYMGCKQDVSVGSQVWKTANGTSWSFVHDHELDVLHLYAFGGLLFAAVRSSTGSQKGLYSYNGSTWTLEHAEMVSGDEHAANFAEIGGELFALYQDRVLKRNGGSWSVVDDYPPSGGGSGLPNKYSLGVYNDELYVSSETGGAGAEVRVYKYTDGVGFATLVFSESRGSGSTRHYAARWLNEFQDELIIHEPRYVHSYDGSSDSLIKTFTYDSKSEAGDVDSIVFNGKLFRGHIFDSGFSLVGGAYYYDGSTWTIASGLNFYSDDDIASFYAPPHGFCKWNKGSGTLNYLYACAGPGGVYIWDDETEDASVPSNILATGISVSKDNDDRAYITGWKPNSLFIRSYIISGGTLTGEIATSLGSATSANVISKTLIAYPHAPITGGDGRCFVFGRFTYDGSVRHVMRTVDGGSNWTVIEDGWGSNICAALLTRNGEVWCVRNKTTQSQLYRGFDTLTYVSTIPFPINNGALALSPDGTQLVAGSNIDGGSPVVYAALFPFTNWVDITFNYPSAGEVTGIVIL